MRPLLVSVAALTLAGTAAADLAIPFRTPSGNIGCYYTSNRTVQATLRCDIRSGLRLAPAKPKSCTLDWGDSYELDPAGRARLTCQGDTAIDRPDVPDPQVRDALVARRLHLHLAEDGSAVQQP